MKNKCNLSAGCSDGYCSMQERYRHHCPMRHVQGYSGSHWILALGDYLLRIAPASARATGTKQQSTNTQAKLAVLMATAMRWYDTVCIAQWMRSRALLEATGCHHWASACSNSINWTCQHLLLLMFFIVKSSKKATKPQG